MPHLRSLLERLEFPPAPDRRSLPGDVGEVIDSILRHLQSMLNTRHHGSESAPDYGTSDLSDYYTGLEAIDTLRREIRQTVEKYEPRLTNIQVSSAAREDDPYHLYFEIVGTIVSEDRTTPAVFRTMLEGTGELKVTRG